MNQTQSIIVYRNPVEQAFWESGMVWPLFVFLSFVVIWVWLLHKLTEWISNRNRWGLFSAARKRVTYIGVVLGLVAAAASTYFVL